MTFSNRFYLLARPFQKSENNQWFWIYKSDDGAETQILDEKFGIIRIQISTDGMVEKKH